MAIPTKIKQLANDVRTKIYGRDVRESIAKGMEETGGVAGESNERSKNTANRQDHIEARYDVAVGAHTVDSEVLDARINLDGDVVHPNLKERLDVDYSYLTSHLDDMSVSIKDYGAIGDGENHPLSEFFTSLSDAKSKYPFVTSLNQETDWAAIQLALNENIGKNVVFIPHGVFMISDTIVLPTKEVYGRRNNFIHLIGATMAGGYKDTIISNVSYGSVLYATNKDVTVLSTAEKMPPPADDPWMYQTGWTRLVHLENFNIIGRQAARVNWDDSNQTNKYSVGLKLDGIHTCRLENISIEGFGQGLRIEDALVNAYGVIRLANNYRGLEATRSSNINDCIFTCEKFTALTNVINVSLDNARSIKFLSGDIQNAEISNEKGTPNFTVKNSAELDLHLGSMTLESNRSADDKQPLIDIDKNGINLLTIDKSNITSLVNSSLIKTRGYFDVISVTENIFHGSRISTHQPTGVSEYMPLIDIQIESEAENTGQRSMTLNTDNNSPVELQSLVRSNYQVANKDFVPKSFKQVNLLPTVDRSVQNMNLPFNTNNYGYSLIDVISGKARLYFINDDSGFAQNALDVYLTDSRGNNPLKDVDTLILTIICDSANGTKIPFIYRMWNGNFSQIDYFSGNTFTQKYVNSGEIYINGKTFYKYTITVKLNRDSGLFESGIQFIRLGNIRGGSAYSGIEQVKIYAPTNRVLQETRFFGNPLGDKGGYWEKGDRLIKNNPLPGGYAEFVRVETGLIGLWKGSNLIED